jgi:hypothetical protein
VNNCCQRRARATAQPSAAPDQHAITENQPTTTNHRTHNKTQGSRHQTSNTVARAIKRPAMQLAPSIIERCKMHKKIIQNNAKQNVAETQKGPKAVQ